MSLGGIASETGLDADNRVKKSPQPFQMDSAYLPVQPSTPSPWCSFNYSHWPSCLRTRAEMSPLLPCLRTLKSGRPSQGATGQHHKVSTPNPSSLKYFLSLAGGREEDWRGATDIAFFAKWASYVVKHHRTVNYPTLPLSFCVILSKLFNHREPQVSLL